MLKLKLLYFGYLRWRTDSLEKTLMLGKIEGRRRRGVTEDEMVGWHHRFNGHESEQTLGDSEGQGSLACCSPWGHKESDTTERLKNGQQKMKALANPKIQPVNGGVPHRITKLLSHLWLSLHQPTSRRRSLFQHLDLLTPSSLQTFTIQELLTCCKVFFWTLLIIDQGSDFVV